MPVTNLEEAKRLFKKWKAGQVKVAPVSGAYASVSPELGEWGVPAKSEEMGKTLAAAIHGTARGMTLGGSEKLLDLVFGPEAEERRKELRPYGPTQKTAEFVGTLLPVSTALKGAYALPWLQRLPKIARAGIANVLAGAGLGTIEQKTPEESRLEKIGKQAALFGGIGVGAAGIAPAVGAIARKEIPVLSRVGQWFVRKPMPEGFQPRIREFYGEAAIKKREAQEIGAELAGLKPAEQVRAKQVIAGGITRQEPLIEVTEKPITRFIESTEKFKETGLLEKPYFERLTRRELNTLQTQKSGLEKELARLQGHSRFPGRAEKIRSAEEQIGRIDRRIWTHYHEGGTQYFPRMYMSKEQQKGLSRWGFFKPFRFKGKRTYLKARQDIPEHIRKEMGEIMTAPYPVQKRLTQLSYDTAVFNMFDDVARNPNWSTTSAEIAKERGWVKLTKTPTWGLGPLRKSYVHPDIAETLNGMSEIRKGFWKAYDQFLGAWKYAKVVPRPGTWARNIFNNFVFADFAGISLTSPKASKVLGSVIKDYATNGPMRQELLRAGLLGAEYLPAEASVIMDAVKKSEGNIFSATANLMKRGARDLGRFYTAQDQIFKEWIYAYELALGKSKDEALKAAFRWMPNYREVPRLTQVLRRVPIGAPFFSFTSEAVRIAGEAAREQPLKLAKWVSLPIVMEEVSKRKLGLSETEWQEAQKTFPEYMQGGLHVLLPIGDKQKFRVLDMTYMMFYGDAIEYSARPSIRLMSNPFFTAVAEAVTGIDTFTGKPIVRHTKPTIKEKIQDWADYLYRDFMPAVAPEIPGTGIKGGFDYMKWKRTLAGEPHPWTGRKTPIGETVAATLGGLKTREMRPKELRVSFIKRKESEIDELTRELWRVAVNRSLTEKERQKRIENIRVKIERVRDELQ